MMSRSERRMANGTLGVPLVEMEFKKQKIGEPRETCGEGGG